jgi:hypothetical protein
MQIWLVDSETMPGELGSNVQNRMFTRPNGARDVLGGLMVGGVPALGGHDEILPRSEGTRQEAADSPRWTAMAKAKHMGDNRWAVRRGLGRKDKEDPTRVVHPELVEGLAVQSDAIMMTTSLGARVSGRAARGNGSRKQAASARGGPDGQSQG